MASGGEPSRVYSLGRQSNVGVIEMNVGAVEWSVEGLSVTVTRSQILEMDGGWRARRSWSTVVAPVQYMGDRTVVVVVPADAVCAAVKPASVEAL